MRATKWAKVIDNSRCIGCHACSVACKAEHDTPLGVVRTYVKEVEVGTFPNVQRHFQVTRCNQCDEPPCVDACPVSAMFQRTDGIVDFDRERCIGCSACMAACPYDAIYINPENHSAEKCNFCAHRIDRGLEPACVSVCPTQAILIGDLDDPESVVSKVLTERTVEVRAPEKGTSPKLFYADPSPSTLIPTFAGSGPIQMATQSRNDANGHDAGRSPRRTNSIASNAAAGLISYGQPSSVPWDWRVSAYTWTKSISGGTFLVLALMIATGQALSASWQAGISVVSLGFLGLTGIILVAHLTHPLRFLYILRWPQWRSWLTRGAYILLAYGALQCAFLFATFAGYGGLANALLVPGAPLALLTAVYTAFLLAQAKGRDLWQSRLLPAHLSVQATLAGFSTIALLTAIGGFPGDPGLLRWGLFAAALAYVLLLLLELNTGHSTDDARRAFSNLVSGQYRLYYKAGVLMGGLLPVALAALSVSIDQGEPLLIGASVSLVGLLLYEHGYIQAGQSVPLS